MASLLLLGAGGKGSAGVVAPTAATWDPATATAVTLSGGDLAATNTGTTSGDQGAKVAIASGKSTGKYYWEATRTSVAAAGNFGIGMGTTASTYTGMGTAVSGNLLRLSTGNFYDDGSSTGISLGAISQGQVIGVAVDFTNDRIWFRKAPSGFWNNDSGASPATNTNGLPLRGSGSMIPFVVFGGTGGTASNAATANFGATAFSGAVPSGFTSGWPP